MKENPNSARARAAKGPKTRKTARKRAGPGKSAKASDCLIVSGYSGAGMSSVLKALEDIDYEVFDNFPLPLVGPLLRLVNKKTMPIAIGLDTRTRGFSDAEVFEVARKIGARVVFVTCDEDVLYKRFTETRRRHPLARNKPVRFGIKKEHKLLSEIKSHADILIDTSHLSVHDLRHIVEGHFAPAARRLTITLMSFGFRNGLPREADIVMDVRFLKNPHWKKSLRPKTGEHEQVQAYIQKDAAFAPFIEGFQNLLSGILPRYKREGKNYLTIAIGCTGGRHRSVFVVESLRAWLRSQGIKAHIDHRDVDLTSD